MTTASRTPSPGRRIRILGLAGLLALGTMFPMVVAVRADGAVADSASGGSGFDISVASVDELTGLTAVISADGDGANLRADPAQDDEVLESIPDGTTVNLRIDMVDTVIDADGVTRWWPVTFNGQDGWVSGLYLSDGTSQVDAPDATDSSTTASSAKPSDSGAEFDFTGEATADSTARVAGSGESVNVRAEPAVDSDVVAIAADGEIVTLRIAELDTVYDGDGVTRWWPVTVNGVDGWISGFYLGSSDDAAASNASSSTTTFAPGSYVQANTGDGDNVNVRAQGSPAAAAIGELADGEVAQVVGGPVSFESSAAGWYEITTGDLTGFVDGDLVIAASQPETSPDTSPSSAFVTGDYAKVVTQTQAGANIRAAGNPDAAETGFVPEASVVQIVSGPDGFVNSINGWYRITFDGTTGFVDGDLLVKVDAPAPATTPAASASGQFAAGDYVAVSSKTGAGVNVRESATMGSAKVGFRADDAILRVTDGPVLDEVGDPWYRVSDGDVTGWIVANLLVKTSAPTDGTDGTAANPTPAATEPAAVPSQLAYPLTKYTRTQGFGCSSLGFYAYNADFGCPVHDGLDLATAAGTPIMAAAAGTVVAAGWCDCGLGYYVEIDHGDGLHTLYGHMARQPFVSSGQRVNQGDVIGPVGSTGVATGPHVHFMVRVDGVAKNPEDYLP